MLRFLPNTPATAPMADRTRERLDPDRAGAEQARIGAPASHNLLAAFRNPRILLLGAIGFLLIGVITTFILSAPMVLAGATGLDTHKVGYLVSLGGIVGAIAMLVAGNYADRHGDRFLNAFWCAIVLAGALLVITLSPAPWIVMLAYLAFALSCFTVPMLTSSGWAEVLHVRELAVGAAAINTMSQIGAFVSPFAWGVARDATGTFNAGLAALVMMTLLMAALVLLLRAQVHNRPFVVPAPNPA